MIPAQPGRRDRVAGGLVGLLIGDAVGVPYEFHAPEDLPPREHIDLVPPPHFPRAHASVPPGTWSDDGAQALCLLASLLHAGTFDLDDFSRRLVNWREVGYLAVDFDVFDVGIQTSRAISHLRSGVPPHQAGPAGERDNGNGSLMRVLPLALWHRGSDRELVEFATRQSLPTHGHARSQLACAFACLWARAELDGAADSWHAASNGLREHAPALGLPDVETDIILDVDNARRVGGSGYVVDTLWSARHALDTGASFDAVVRSAIALGNDTDTTAAVAGGIAGIRYGLDGIPLQWRNALRGADLLAPLLAGLLARDA
jgi:ADP-ribosylglycohydrolase